MSETTRKSPDLDALLAPVGAEEFFADYWERAPLHVRRGDASLYEPIVAAADLGRVARGALSFDEGAVELLGDPARGAGEIVAAGSEGELEAAYARGSSFRVMGMERFWPGARDVACGLAQRLGCPVAANLYATPPGARGAPRHYDNHDVLVLQLAGRKRWLVYEPVVELPLAHVPPLAFEERGAELKYARGGPKKGRAQIEDEEVGAPPRELTLEPGDLLYLPRGYVHEARTEGEASAHLTMGLHVVTWLDLLTVALGQRAQRDVRLRRAVPAGLLDDAGAAASARAEFESLTGEFAREARVGDALAEVAEALVRSRRAADEEEQDEHELSAETILERRPGALLRVVSEGGMVGLLSADAALWMPAPFAPALRFAARSTRFRVSELPGNLTDSGRLALARQMLRDRLVRKA